MSSLPLALGTLIECPATLPEPRPPLMKRRCARCELVLGWVVCAPEQHGEITHGSCDGCVAALLDEFDQWRATTAAASMADEYSEFLSIK